MAQDEAEGQLLTFDESLWSCVEWHTSAKFRVLSSGGGGAGGKLPPQKKDFPEKKLKAISNTDLI